jgi:hypothetical protein
MPSEELPELAHAERTEQRTEQKGMTNLRYTD